MTFVDRNWARICRTYFKLRGLLRVPARPDSVQWLTTSACNLRCAHCGTNAGRPARDELSTAEMKDIVDQLAALGTDEIQLTGGEPLVRPDLFEILRYAAARGIRYTLVTNGTHVARFAKELSELPPAAIKVSVDGIPATHDRLRGAANFDAAMRALEFFRDLPVGTRVLCTTLNRANCPELHELFGHVRASAATHWEFHLCIREGRAQENAGWMFLTREEVEALFRFILQNKGRFPIFLGEGYYGPLTPALTDQRFFCGSGWSTFTIMPNGDVAGCPAFEARWTEGNVRDRPLAWIWRHRFERFRRLADDLPESCRRCDYLQACGGGCWMERRTGDHCFRDVWEKWIPGRQGADVAVRES
ncbi:MAG: radical SAM protein [Planctomycetes bacterium]|nr:radical SAM protein [Planctomycetota bacterium]